jgi:sn-glycerol 3-phosphate transport system substrate-binding protein
MMTMYRSTPLGRRRRRRRATTLLLSLAALAGCADDDDATDTTDTGTSDGNGTATPVETESPTAPSTSGQTSSVPATGSTGPASAGTLEPEPTECPVGALPESGSPVEITLWHAMSATNGVVLEQLIADYNATHERVHVTPVFQGGYGETFTKYVNTLRTGGELPTLVQLNETYLQTMVDSESIVPVDDCVVAAGYDLSDFSDVLLDQYRLDGELVTMPFQLANPVLFYDGNDFVAAGLDPAAPPTTLDELVATSRALVEAGAVTSGIVLPIDAWPIEQWIATAGEMLVDHDNGRSGRAERARFETDAVAELLVTLQSMQDDGLLQITGRGGEQAGLAPYIAVAQGEAAMTIGSSANLGEIYQQIGRVPDVDVRVGPFPGMGGRTTIGGGSIYLTDETDDAERAAAWDLLAWLNEPDQQVRWAMATGYVPTRLSAADDPELIQLWNDRPGFRVAWDQLAVEGEVPGGGGPVIGDYLGVRDAIEDGLEALYAGDSPESVRAAMQEAADQAIAAYNDRIGNG